MFKHKIIKYFLIFSSVLFSLIMIAVLRLSYKPLDISYFSDYHSLFNNKVPEISNLKSEKAYLKLNVLKNELSI